MWHNVQCEQEEKAEFMVGPDEVQNYVWNSLYVGCEFLIAVGWIQERFCELFGRYGYRNDNLIQRIQGESPWSASVDCEKSKIEKNLKFWLFTEFERDNSSETFSRWRHGQFYQKQMALRLFLAFFDST